jgi:hypothetical protein
LLLFQLTLSQKYLNFALRNAKTPGINSRSQNFYLSASVASLREPFLNIRMADTVSISIIRIADKRAWISVFPAGTIVALADSLPYAKIFG